MISNASPEEPGTIYDEAYYRTGCGPVPYTRSEPHWPVFFGGVADQVIRALRPERVLDVGCALGFLVEAFWDRGVEAHGIDISPYALENVRRDMRPYCSLASVADGIEGRYDLIACIEVLEHMRPDQSQRAIEHMTRATDAILFSSSPSDLKEPTHINVRPVISWLALFQGQGFSPALDFDASFVAPHAMLLRKRAEPYSEEVLRLFAHFIRQRSENTSRAELLREKQSALDNLTREAAHRQKRIETLDQQLAEARDEIARASDMQDEIRRELEAANQEVQQLAVGRPVVAEHAPKNGNSSELLENVAAALRAHGASMKALEFRIGSIEQKNAQITESVSGILQSKIWKTLVRGGGVLQRFLG